MIGKDRNVYVMLAPRINTNCWRLRMITLRDRSRTTVGTVGMNIFPDPCLKLMWGV